MRLYDSERLEMGTSASFAMAVSYAGNGLDFNANGEKILG
jgi:hypothetical protein